MFCREFRVNVLLRQRRRCRQLVIVVVAVVLSVLFSYKNLLRCCCFHSFHTFFFALPSPPSLALYSYLFSSLRLFSTQNSSNGFSLDRCIHVTTHFFRSFVRSLARSIVQCQCLCRARFYLFTLHHTTLGHQVKMVNAFVHLNKQKSDEK